MNRPALIEAVLDDLDLDIIFTDGDTGTEFGVGFTLTAEGDALAYVNPDHVAIFGCHLGPDDFGRYVEAVGLFIRSALELVPLFGFGDDLERQIHLHMIEVRPDLVEVLHEATDLDPDE